MKSVVKSLLVLIIVSCTAFLSFRLFNSASIQINNKYFKSLKIRGESNVLISTYTNEPNYRTQKNDGVVTVSSQGGTNDNISEVLKSEVLKTYVKTILDSEYGKMPVNDLISALIEATGPDRQLIYQTLVIRKKEALPVIKERLRNGGTYEKYTLTKFLSVAAWEETKEEMLMLAASSKENWNVRKQAVFALGGLGDITVGPAIAQLLIGQNNIPTGFQGACISTLARIGYRDAYSIIEPYTRSEDPLVAIWAGRSLVELGLLQDYTIFLKYLNSEDYVVRQEACAALHAFNDETTLNILEKISRTDPNEAVRIAAKRTLIEIKIRNSMAQEKINVLEEELKKASKYEINWLLQALWSNCGAEGKKSVLRLAANNDSIGLYARRLLVFSEY